MTPAWWRVSARRLCGPRRWPDLAGRSARPTSSRSSATRGLTGSPQTENPGGIGHRGLSTGSDEPPGSASKSCSHRSFHRQ